MIIKNQSPKGGTELQLGFLTKHVDKSLLDQVQICTSIPDKVPLDPNKVNILWQKNSWDQPNLYPWFKNKANHHKYDWYVFNSHWMQLVKNPLISLDVYSSTEIYGKDFYKKNDHNYTALYKQAEELPNVNYIGYKPNGYIREHIKDYNMYVYPSIFEETSCISLLESMAAGLYCITTNYGALFETGAEFPMYIAYDNNYRNLAEKFAYGIEASAAMLHEPTIQEHLTTQSSYTKKYYNWNKQASSWTRFLQGAINAKK